VREEGRTGGKEGGRKFKVQVNVVELLVLRRMGKSRVTCQGE
jgi:hypothetical protein